MSNEKMFLRHLIEESFVFTCCSFCPLKQLVVLVDVLEEGDGGVELACIGGGH